MIHAVEFSWILKTRMNGHWKLWILIAKMFMQHPPIFQLLEDETFHCNKKWCQQQSRRAFTSFLCSRRFFINSHALHTEASWETYHPTCMHIFRWIELSSVTTHDKFAIIPPVNFQHISRRRGASKRISHRSMCVWVHKSHKNEWNIFDTFDGTASRRSWNWQENRVKSIIVGAFLRRRSTSISGKRRKI